MNIAVGFSCLVAVAVTAVVTGAPEQQLAIEDQITDYDVSNIFQEDPLERQSKSCGTKRSCRIAGGRCQPLTEECDGELRTAGFYCRHSQKCGCCIPAGPPGCVFGFKTYEVGAIIEDVCMLLQCTKGGNWKYLGKVRHECVNCMVFGDPHFYTFDDNPYYYEYSGVGDYTISQHGLGQQNQKEFGVNSEFVYCTVGDDVSCVKDVTYYEPGITIRMTIPEPVWSCNGYNDPLCAITVYVDDKINSIGSSVKEFYATDGTVLVFRHNHVDINYGIFTCMNVVGSQGLSVSFCSVQNNYAFLYIFAMPSLRSVPSQLYGLCGTYTGRYQEYGYTERNGTTTTDTDTFAESWKIGGTGNVIDVNRAASVNKCLNATVLSEITAECLQITKEACAVMSPPWCLAINAACVFDLCRMPNHASYAAGYANHMAVHTHLARSFDSLPSKVYLKLDYYNIPLGEIIIDLDGYNYYPRRVQQFLELCTGNNNVDGTWKKAGFNMGSPYPDQPGEWIGCSGYMVANGNGQVQTASLIPVEGDGNPDTPVMQGNVLGIHGQSSGFYIRTRSWTGARVVDPVIGHITSGFNILQAIAARGDAFVKAVKFSDCGLVVIDQLSKINN